MPRLAAARGDQIAAIYRESHALWGAGLSLADYEGLWADVLRTAWARRFFTYHVWLGGRGEVLSSLKLYRPVARLLGRTGRAAALGAIFTPKARRRQGHAEALVRAVLEAARSRGDHPALLFSDIGTDYYARLGFRALPAEQAEGRLGRGAGRAPAGWTLRPMGPGDLGAVREAHDAWCERRPLAVVRDREHWEFLLVRAMSFFSRLDGSDLSRRYRVALRDGRFGGYLITVEGNDEWIVREVGAPGADRESMAAILRAGAAEARRAGFRRVGGWLPRETTDLVPEWGMRHEPRRGAVPMVALLDGAADVASLDTPDRAFLPYLDQF